MKYEVIILSFPLIYGIYSITYASVYQGCFKDSLFRTMSAIVVLEGMTIEWCIQYCYDIGYSYAGLQYGDECRCSDDTYSDLGQASEFDCHIVCDGNPQEICGGDLRNSVYATANLRCVVEASPRPTTNGTPMNVTASVYQGCFKDAFFGRTMSALVSHDVMTTEWCIQYCYDLGYPYAGLQDGEECRCSGETYSELGQAPDDDCRIVCGGNPQEICGGAWRNSVYSTANLERCTVDVTQSSTTIGTFNSAIFKSSSKLDGFCQTSKGSCTRCAFECLRALQCKAFRYDDTGCHLISDPNDQQSMTYYTVNNT